MGVELHVAMLPEIGIECKHEPLEYLIVAGARFLVHGNYSEISLQDLCHDKAAVKVVDVTLDSPAQVFVKTLSGFTVFALKLIDGVDDSLITDPVYLHKQVALNHAETVGIDLPVDHHRYVLNENISENNLARLGNLHHFDIDEWHTRKNAPVADGIPDVKHLYDEFSPRADCKRTSARHGENQRQRRVGTDADCRNQEW